MNHKWKRNLLTESVLYCVWCVVDKSMPVKNSFCKLLSRSSLPIEGMNGLIRSPDLHFCGWNTAWVIAAFWVIILNVFPCYFSCVWDFRPVVDHFIIWTYFPLSVACLQMDCFCEGFCGEFCTSASDRQLCWFMLLFI